MIEAKAFVSILFKIINFALLVWVLRYVFKKYVLTEIQERRKERFAFFAELEKKQSNLKIEESLINKEIVDQEKLFEVLKEKIKTWNAQVKGQEEKRKQEEEKFLALSKKRVIIKHQNMHSQKLLAEIFPRVISGTYNKLEQKFSDEQESEKFFRNIMEYLKSEAENQKYVNLGQKMSNKND